MESPEWGADRSPPYDRDAEMAVLCAMMIERTAAPDAIERLEPGMFFSEAHRRIFKAMTTCFERGAAIDYLTLTAQLRDTRELEAVGGENYIAGLIDVIPSARNLHHHAAIVRDKARLRRLVEVSTQAIRDVYDMGGRTTDELIAEAETRVLTLGEATGGQYVRVKQALWPVFEQIERRQEHTDRVPGIPTGLVDLDRMMLGLHRGQLTVVAGRPSMGKTALAIGWALNATLEAQVPTLVFSFEMTTTELVTRAIAMEGRMDLQALNGGRPMRQEEHQRMAAAAGHLNAAPLFIDDAGDVDINSVMARARRAKKAEGVELILIDYLQLMEATGENRRQEIDVVTRRLKRMARELNVAVVLLSQLSRAPEGRSDKRPQMSDLRESGGIEQDADNIVGVYRPEYYMAPEKRVALNGNSGLTELSVLKQRNGPTGSVSAWFRATSTRFENVLRDAQGQLL